MRILSDTREQQPLLWIGYSDLKITTEKLDCGDYTIVCHDRPNDDFSVIIERKKNCQELIGNLGTNWDRFEAEAQLMVKYQIRQIVVCGPDNFKFLYDYGFTQMQTTILYKRLAYLQCVYGISTVFLPNREAAELYIYRLFKEVMILGQNYV